MAARSFGALVLAVLAGAAARFPGQGPSRSFAGVWYMDTTKFVKHDRVLVALELNITQRGDTVDMIADVTDQLGPNRPLTKTAVPTHYVVDGREWKNQTGTGVVATTVAAWQHDTLMYTSTSRGPDSLPIVITTRWVLDANGTTLTQVQRMQHGKRDLLQTLLFTKR